MATSQLSGVIQHLRRVLRDDAGQTDRELLEDYISRRDDAAFAALVCRHGPMVWGVCSRVLANYPDAEDAFQATFLVLVRKAVCIASRELVANWLYGVAHQTALKARATIAKRKGRERQVTEMPEPAVTQQDQWRDLKPLLDEELSRLPDKYRGVIVHCDLEGKTRKEAARHLGLPEGTVASRLVRARSMLAKRLARRSVALSDGPLAAVLAQHAVSTNVPTSVMDSTIKAASLLAAGKAATTGAISAKVASLAEGVLKTMFLSKLKAVVAVALVLGFFVTGATVLTYRTVAAQSATPAPPTAAARHTTSILEGSKAGDRKELVPGFAFRWCPAGNFKMGEGDDAIDVELSKGFWLGETEVTQGQWKKLMGTSPWSGRTGVGARASTDTTSPKEGPDYSASYISYDDALSFCKKLTTQEQGAGRLPKSWKYSLPTEAQWEYACRAGKKTKFSFGNDESKLNQYAWFGDNVNKVKQPYAHQVGLKKPNAWGLCDMHGNVWEWCNDWYGSKLPGGKDPVGPPAPPPPGGPPVPVGPITPPPPDGSSGRNRVIRGGSWVDVALTCSSANRGDYNPRLGNSVQGFRLAAVPAGLDDKKPTAEKPVEPVAKQEKEKEAFTAWGKEVGGVQAGLSFLPGKPRAYHHSQTVKLVVRVRNVGKESVQLQYVKTFFVEEPPIVTDAGGKRLSLDSYPIPKEKRNLVKLDLAPGKEVEIDTMQLQLRPEGFVDQFSPIALDPTIRGTGKLQVRYGRLAPADIDNIAAKLSTGELELEIKADPPPANEKPKTPKPTQPKSEDQPKIEAGEQGMKVEASDLHGNALRISFDDSSKTLTLEGTQTALARLIYRNKGENEEVHAV